MRIMAIMMCIVVMIEQKHTSGAYSNTIGGFYRAIFMGLTQLVGFLAKIA